MGFFLHSSSGHLSLVLLSTCTEVLQKNVFVPGIVQKHYKISLSLRKLQWTSEVIRSPVRDCPLNGRFLKRRGLQNNPQSNWRQLGPYLLPKHQYYPPGCTGQTPHRAATAVLFLQTPGKHHPVLLCQMHFPTPLLDSCLSQPPREARR